MIQLKRKSAVLLILTSTLLAAVFVLTVTSALS